MNKFDPEKEHENDFDQDLDLNMFVEREQEAIKIEDEEETCGSVQTTVKCTCKKKTCNCKCGTEKESKQMEGLINEKKEKNNLCSKCNEKKATLKFRNDACCNKCFIVMIEHKFKYTLRNLLKVVRDDHILVCISGGPNSTALLKLMSETLFNPGAKKMFFSVQVIHIDERIVYEEEGKNKYEENLLKIKELCALMKFKLDIIKIEEVFSLQNTDDFIPKLPDGIGEIVKEEQNEKFKVFLNNLSTKGYSREGMLHVFKLALILSFAKMNKIKKVALADTGQVVACKILSEIIQGRGVEIQNMVKFLDEKFEKEGVIVGRPLRDFLKKEILLYNHIYKLEDFLIIRENISSNNKGLPGNGNFNILLEDLLDRLQEQNNATVHTVLNTLEKVKPKYDYFKEEKSKICPVCFNQRDKLFNILEIGTLKNLNSKKNDKALISDYLPDKSNDETDFLKKMACFGCRRMVENSKNPEILFKCLPNFMKGNFEKAEKEFQNNKKDKISEFFLEEHEKY